MREHARVRAVIVYVRAKPSLQIALCAVCMLAASICEAGGTHLRLPTAHGPLHIWWPSDYDPTTAGVVVYVHGYYTDVDHAWKEHRLAEQFEASRINALFIACEAPAGPRPPVRWTSLGDLLDVVSKHVPKGLPAGRVTVMGHSGAHRTISEWLGDPRLDTIVLLDALYGDVDEMREWFAAQPERRLIDAASLTKRWGDELHETLPETLEFDQFPDAEAMRAARNASVIYVRSAEDHMRLVTGGAAIPVLLQALQLRLIDETEGTSGPV